MALFDGNNIKLDVLKKWAYNYRWAEVPEGTYRVYGANGEFLCLSRAKDGTLTSIKNFFGA